ncbi:MAG: thioredoxin fold domain-containing protein [Polaromonas sp.]
MLITASLFLAGCNDAPGTGATEKAGKSATTPVSMSEMAEQATGFTAGSQMSARTVYVFFDAQCPHCGALWNAAKPLRSQARFVWIPVGIINASSTAQGATLLAAADPVAAMDEHETSLLAKQGGISAAANLDAQKASVAKNTELMTRFGFASIPTIVGTHAQTGALVTQEGSMPTAALANLLGLQVPASPAN